MSENNNTPNNNNPKAKSKRRRHYHKHHKSQKAEAVETAEIKEVSSPESMAEDTHAEKDAKHHNNRRGRNRNRHRHKKDNNLTVTEELTLKEDTETYAEELTDREEELAAFEGIHDLDDIFAPIEKPLFDENEPTYDVIGVRFGGGSKSYYFDPEDYKLSVGDGVIVETARGDKYGICSLANCKVPQKHVFLPLKKVIRPATEEDKRINEENIKLSDEAFRIGNAKIAEHKLEMKLIDAAYTHDRSKLIFFFTSPSRVDFRELVKDLASVFRTRIDLRQIGIRDEAKMIGGYGVCGRPLCCCRFLPNFNQVSIKMAKEQNLSLNTSKISGVCGRLMCCLKFEQKVYAEEAKLLPPIGSIVSTPDGNGVVIELSPIAGMLKVKLHNAQDAMPKMYPKKDISIIKRGNTPASDPDSEADNDE